MLDGRANFLKDNFDIYVYQLISRLLSEQWNKKEIVIPDQPILTRQMLKARPLNGGMEIISTSGSTGEPVIVEKTYQQKIWHAATNILEMIWRGWDPSKKLAVITPVVSKEIAQKWMPNPYIYRNVGEMFIHPTTGNLQEFIDRVKCDYLYTYPSIAKTINTSSFIDIRTSSEIGGTMYSCEEAGTIAITCPDNPDVMHVMPNILLEIDENSEVIITDTMHPYLHRYKLNDIAEFTTCNCGRGFQTIKSNIIGRIRNLAVAEDGSRFWPVFGTISFCKLVPTLERYQAVQLSLKDIELRVTGLISEEDEAKLLNLMKSRMGDFYNYSLKRIEKFENKKHEEFICLI